MFHREAPQKALWQAWIWIKQVTTHVQLHQVGIPIHARPGDPFSLCLRQTYNTHIPQNPMKRGNWKGQKALQWSSIPSSLSSLHFWPLSFFLFPYGPPPGPSSQATIAAFTLQVSDPSKADLIFPWTVNIIPSPSLASSDNCSFGKSTSKVIIKEPLMLLLSKLGSPSPFFHSLAPGLVILSREICTWKAKGDGLEKDWYSWSTTQLPVSAGTQSSCHSAAEHQDVGASKTCLRGSKGLKQPQQQPQGGFKRTGLSKELVCLPCDHPSE